MDSSIIDKVTRMERLFQNLVNQITSTEENANESALLKDSLAAFKREIENRVFAIHSRFDK